MFTTENNTAYNNVRSSPSNVCLAVSLNQRLFFWYNEKPLLELL